MTPKGTWKTVILLCKDWNFRKGNSKDPWSKENEIYHVENVTIMKYVYSVDKKRFYLYQ